MSSPPAPVADDDDDTRHMNDTTMPPPPRNNHNNNQGGTTVTKTTTSLVNNKNKNNSTTPANITASNNNPRRRPVPLRKGFGLADWNKLVRTATDLAQLQGRPLQRYRWSDIKPHKAPYDGWVVLRGKVYNLSPYLPYHPGGESILRKVLGKDITALYDKYHPWVNEEG